MDNPDEIELRAQLEDCHLASYGWALNCCYYNHTEAKDVLQTVYLKVLDGRARFKGQSLFKTWLFSVIRNTAADERRRRWFRLAGLAKFAKETVTDSESGGNEDNKAPSEMSGKLKLAMAQLSNRQREVLHLVFYDGMTLESAASAMGVSIGSARTHYDRGKQNMRKLLNGTEVSNEE